MNYHTRSHATRLRDVVVVVRVREVVVDFTWDPPWSEARLSEAGRRAMGLPA